MHLSHVGLVSSHLILLSLQFLQPRWEFLCFRLLRLVVVVFLAASFLTRSFWDSGLSLTVFGGVGEQSAERKPEPQEAPDGSTNIILLRIAPFIAVEIIDVLQEVQRDFVVFKCFHFCRELRILITIIIMVTGKLKVIEK